VSHAKTARYASLLLWAAYFAVPTDAGGFIRGVPIGPVDTCALLMLAWLAAYGGRLRGARLAAVVLVASAAIAAAIPGTGGFRARYFANAAGIGGHERSTEYPRSAFTRVDKQLAFTPRGPEFPLAFFNDSSRFNFYRAGEPHRRRLPFSASWSGLWWTAQGSHHLYLNAPQATGELFVDGVPVLKAAPGDSLASGEMTLAEGWHRLDIRYSSPGAPRQLAAGFITNGQYRPFDANTVVTQQIREWQLQAAGILRVAKTVADAGALAWIAWLFALSVRERAAELWRRGSEVTLRRRALPLLIIVAVVEALVFAWPWTQQVMLLTGGDDPLTYESYARDILLNGILMNGGLPAGQGDPFYYQAFYPYFLAAVHFVTGEGAFGVMLAQRLLAAWAAWKIVEMAVMLSREAAWIPALVIGTAFIGWKFWHLAANMSNEALYVPLLVAWSASAMAVCRAPTQSGAWINGLLGGVTAITRSTVLLGWLIAWPLCWLSWKGRRRAGLAIAIVVSSLAVFSLIAIRNGIVTHKFVPTSTEFGVTLLGGNEVPPGVTIDMTARRATYGRLGVSETTAQVIEYAITAPATFLRHLGDKALFALGFYERYAPGWGWSPVYVAVWTTALWGLALAVRMHPRALASCLIPALVALTQFVALVIVYPKGERLIVPIYALLVPYSAVATWWIAVRIVARNNPSGEAAPGKVPAL
jgi:hypothetical protein